MNVEVLFFAAARKHAGTDRAVITIPDRATVADLRTALEREFPGLGRWSAQLMIALDQQYATDSEAIRPDMEIACFPPVSGG